MFLDYFDTWQIWRELDERTKIPPMTDMKGSALNRNHVFQAPNELQLQRKQHINPL